MATPHRIEPWKVLARAVPAVILALLALLPLAGERFITYLAIRVMLLGIFAVGYDLLLGRTGLLSFGHAGFYAAGAYALGFFSLRVSHHPLLGVLVAVAAAALLGLAVGALCVRSSEVYFSMLTLAFGMMIYSIAWKWRDFTGGDDGLVGIPRAPLALPGVFSIDLSAMDRYYYVVLVLSLVATWAMWRLVRSPLGLTLTAIRDSEGRAEFAGVPVRKYRIVAFTVAGLYAGLAGSLLPGLENTVTPPIAHWSTSAEPVLATLLGGEVWVDSEAGKGSTFWRLR